MGIIGQAFIEVIPDASKFATKLHGDIKEGVEKAESSSQDSFGKIASFGQKAFFAVGAAAIGFGAIALAEALKGEESQAQLRNAIKNTGVEFESVAPKVEKLTDGFSKFGYTNDEAEAALTRLVGITGDSAKSMDLLQTAANLAAARHLDLTSAANLVGRAAEGNITPLKRMGITVADTGSSAGNAEAAIKALNDRFGGAAQAQADTYAGKLKTFKAEISNLEEKIGLALLPTLGRAAGILSDTVNFFEGNRIAAAGLAIAIGGPLAVAMAAYIIQQAILIGQKIGQYFLTGVENVAKFAGAIKVAAVSTYEALGPFGIAIAAVSALAIAFDHSDKSASKAGTTYGDAFVSSVKGAGQETEVLTSKVNQLQGAQDVLIEGVKSQTHLYAELGGTTKDAQRYLEATSKEYQNNKGQIDSVNKALKDNKTSTEASTDANKELTTATEKTGNASSDLAQQFGVTTAQVDALATKMKIDLSKATEEQIAQLETAAGRLKITSANSLEYEDALTKLGDKTSDATEKSKAFKTALDLLIGANVDADKAVVTFYGTIDTLGEKLKANGANLDYHTQKGRENIGAVDDAVTAIGNHVTSLDKQGAKADDVRRAFEGDTEALRKQLQQAGFTEGAIDNLIQRYNLVPSSINTLINADPANAQSAIGALYEQAVKVNQQFKQASDLARGVSAGAGLRTFDVGGYVDAPMGAPVPAILHGGEYVLRADQVRGASGGGIPGAPVNVTVNQSFGPGTDATIVALAGRTAREEVTKALEAILGRHTALNPSGGPVN